ncbi:MULTISPECIES: EamA family transporter RarD [unclassified Pseudomonas]|uniref:EamA family transporter RarD n=1 Tax=unclassified Pseudomonas TaxID=196821 RepID=UPI000BC74C88|nr:MULTISPECIES: EamA family transporter RarD [unclassified Pseudomonas]PVZ19828.1 chloramphenicol-sensitive protein RarD [Pseudomonas sp. URIL14HWK12:I12]PVZ26894.1 chloramphenicol-sensitive protein RarD [Pseudomonas sp. URIL14HWK12:I10]PVZ37783.1 chloramphenicol-sensitive protein RarD [Pseudomonas sp. URIL14HWK12:I11]SNZ05685.1 chloramphenicol-sensitive protein RarD [Pseudomonas sp. URIL14HWK12:I9]
MHKGIIASVAASALFATMYYYTSLLAPLTGEEIFGWRMLLTLPCVTLFLITTGDWRLAVGLLRRIRATPVLLVGCIATASLMGVQLWLFLWAPLHGRSLEVSMGYFLLPLTMVLTGKLLWNERLSRLQTVAVWFAAIGVAHEVLRHGSFAWETLVVALGYPVYFVIRRRCRNDHLGGLWVDMLLQAPVALWFVWSGPLSATDLAEHPALYGLIPLLGAISAAALVSYVTASRNLPFSLFGLLSYVEPALLVVVSLLLGETIGADQWPTYGFIWLAVAVLILEGARHLARQRRRA